MKCKHYTQWLDKNFCGHVVGMCEKKGCCINCAEDCNSRCTYAGEPLKESPHPFLIIKKEIIKVSEIIIDGINPRQFIDDESLNDFADSTDDCGFLQPIGVHRFNEAARLTQLIWGKRRVLAATRKKKEELEAIVYEGEMSKLDLLLLSLTENIHREPLMRKEERDAVIKLHKDFGLSIRKIGEKLKKGKSYVGDLISETKYPEDVLKALDGGSISVKVAKKLSDIKEAEMRAKLIERGGELYPEDVKDIGNISTEKVEENLNLIKADKFVKKQMDKLSDLFGNLTPDNCNKTLEDIKTVAEQSYKPLIEYGFMETKPFSEHSEEEIKTLMEGCTKEDRPAAIKYIELNRHILKVIEAVENRVKSFQNPVQSEPVDNHGSIEDPSEITDVAVEMLDGDDVPEDATQVSAGRTVESIATINKICNEICNELTEILGFKTVYKGEIRDGDTPEIHLIMNYDDLLRFHNNLPIRIKLFTH